MIWWKLFYCFLQVGLFSIGGGYAAMPIIKQQVVDLNHWISLQEFTDLISISEMTPGPIAVNSATFVGMQIGGVSGAVAAVIGCILPSCLIVSLLSILYRKYNQMPLLQKVLGCMRAVVVALITMAGLSILIQVLWNGKEIGISNTNVVALILFAGAFWCLVKKKWNPIAVMTGCGVIQMAVYFISTLI